MLSASVLPVGATEKMLNERRRSGRFTTDTAVDMGVRVFREN
jgi:hypothetical protein